MATWSGSLPPPTIAPIVPPVGPGAPIAFRSYRGSASGSRNTVFIGDGPPGSVAITGEFYRPSVLLAFRIGHLVISFVMLVSLVAAMFVALGRPAGTDVPPLFGVLMALVLVSSIVLLVWKGVLVRSAEPATLLVRAADLCRVRSTVNYGLLGWWLLIGPFALILLFTGRRRLRLDVPVSADGRAGLLPLTLLEQRRGDAEVLAARLRLAGAR